MVTLEYLEKIAIINKESGIVQPSHRRFIVAAAIFGIVGGGFLVTAMSLTTRGSMIIVAYAAMLLSWLVYLRRTSWPSFKERFSASFLVFMTATTIAYGYVAVVTPAALNSALLWKNPLPIVASVLFGCASASIVAIASRPPVIGR